MLFGLKDSQINKEKINTYLYYSSLLAIAIISIFFYAPFNYFDYNSDHAIHVLMSKDFQMPRDYFYWGQNRLGSLLPLLAYLLGVIVNIHELYLCSIVQCLFLGVGYFILAKFISNRALKIALAAIIFLPVNEYNALILIGHPYSSQLFSGALFLLSLHYLRRSFLFNKMSRQKQFFKMVVWSFFAATFFLAGIWVSEFNAILILIPIVYIFLDNELKRSISAVWKSLWFLSFVLFAFILVFAVLSVFKHIKGVSIEDTAYDKAFIDNWPDAKRNFNYFIEHLKGSLMFEKGSILENAFNWFLILLTTFLVIRGMGNKNRLSDQRILVYALLITIISATIMLFLSTWNLRSGFCPRYFTPLYIMFCYLMLLLADRETKKPIVLLNSFLFLFFCLGFCYNSVTKTSDIRGPFQKYGEFTQLPPGVLVGDYWDVHKINSIAIENLQSLAYDHVSVRNWEWKEKLLAEKNFYFLDYGNLPGGLKDTISQFGIFFFDSHKSYNFNGTKVKLYYKIFPEQTLRFAIKAYNKMYLSIQGDLRVVANEPDSTKAEVFEMVLKREGGRAFLASNGKFLCSNLPSEGKIYASSDQAWGWEIFYVIGVSGFKVNLKALNGNFVCADKGDNDRLVANRSEAREWETFILEPRQ